MVSLTLRERKSRVCCGQPLQDTAVIHCFVRSLSIVNVSINLLSGFHGEDKRVTFRQMKIGHTLQ